MHSRILIASLFVFRLTAQSVITTVAGTEWVFPAKSLPALSAPLGFFTSLAVAPNGDLFIGDCSNSLIFRFDSTGTLSIAAGTGFQGSGPGGPALAVPVNCPNSLAFAPSGELFFLDQNSSIRKLTLDGRIVNVAGGGSLTGENVAALSANIGSVGFTLDSRGNLYYSDVDRHQVRRVTPDGNVTTIAGTGENGFSGDGGPARQAKLYSPTALAITATGELLLVDSANNRIRKIDAAGNIQTVAGNGQSGNSGDGGPALTATLALGGRPPLLAQPDGGFLIGVGSRLRRVSPAGVISVIAGRNFGYSGDGGLATMADIGNITSIASNTAGDLWIADSLYARIRLIKASGIIATVAGNGKARATPDIVDPRSAWIYQPVNIAVSPAGLLTFSDLHSDGTVRQLGADGLLRRIAGGVAGTTDPSSALTRRLNYTSLIFDRAANLLISNQSGEIFRVTSDGRVTVIAGRPGGFDGDGRPASETQFGDLRAIAVSPAGELYVGTYSNYRIRKIGLDGIVTTIVGNGTSGFSGDGGPAVAARISSVEGLAFDSAGNLYFTDSLNHRVRRVSTSGVISTSAGDGEPRFRGDNGPAAAASLATPGSLCFDAAGNLLIADTGNGRVRKVGTNGVISTIAGGGPLSETGDGGPADRATLLYPRGLAIDSGNRIYIAEFGGNRIRAILPSPPPFTATPAEINLSSSSPTGQIRLNSPVSGLAFSTSVSPGAGWLTVVPPLGNLPVVLPVTANPSGLAPGRYTATVTVNVPLATPPSRQIQINFTVDSPPSAGLSIGSKSVAFSLQQGAEPSSITLSLSHSSSAPISYSASLRGESWLAVTPSQGQLNPGVTASLRVTASPGALPPGTYSETLTITTPGETVVIPVTLAVSITQAKILLSQTGLTFVAVQGGGPPAPQRIGVINEGSGILDFTTSSQLLQGGSWLKLSNEQGRLTRPLEEVKYVDLAVNHSGVPTGDYYAALRFSAPGVTTQIATILLRILPPGSDPGPEITPSGVVFIGSSNSQIAPESVSITNISSANLNYVSGVLSFENAKFFTHAPASASVQLSEPRRMLVEPQFAGLSPGVRRAALTIYFDNNTSRTINVLSIVTSAPPATNKASAREAASCPSPALRGEFVTLPDGSPVTLGQPVALQVKFADECGNLLNAEQGFGAGVVIRFSNGDPDLRLVSVGGGVWTGTWRPLTPTSLPVTLTAAAAYARGLTVQAGVSSRSVRLSSVPSDAPIVRQGSLVHGASQRNDAPVAPGSLVTLYGANLADSAASNAFTPLPTTVDGTEVLLGGQALPLLYTSRSQINAQVPFDLTPNTTHQVVVRRKGTQSVPETFTVAAAQPGIFTTNQRGFGQAIILGPDQLTIADAAAPARPNDVIVIYCTGLGAVTPSVTQGAAAPTFPLASTVNEVTVTAGGKSARVLFSGLVPGFAGLYQVNAILAPDTPPGDEVQLTLSVDGQASNTVSFAVKN